MQFSASVTLLYRGVNPSDVVRHASRAGFKALEFQILRPDEARAFGEALHSADLRVALMNMDLGDFGTGGLGLAGVPGRAAEFRAALARAREDAGVLGARCVHVGPSRLPAGAHRDEYVAQLLENLRLARDVFAPWGTTVVVEALNRIDYPDILIGSPEEALDVLDRAGREGLGLQYDIYHAARTGRDIGSDLSRYAARLAHVQFADHPGRHEPGSGRLPLAEYFTALDALGYTGFCGAEYVPSGQLDAGLGWLTGAKKRSLQY